MRWLSMSLPMSNYRVVSFKAKSKLEIGTKKNINHEITRDQTHELAVVFRVISCAFVDHLFSVVGYFEV